jgi:hypothetical protein
MTISPDKAWAIFKADKLGQSEAKTVIEGFSKEEQEEYLGHVEGFEMKLAQIGVEAQNEAATIAEDNPEVVAEVNALEPYDWTADHYVKVVSLFKGTKFEKLHLSSAFRIANGELLLAMVKP